MLATSHNPKLACVPATSGSEPPPPAAPSSADPDASYSQASHAPRLAKKRSSPTDEGVCQRPKSAADAPSPASFGSSAFAHAVSSHRVQTARERRARGDGAGHLRA